MSALRSLLAVFDIQVNDEELEHGEKKIKGFIGKLKEVGEVVLEAFAFEKVNEFFTSVIEGAAHTQDLSDRLGVAVGFLKDFQFAMQSAGVDADSSAHSLGFLNRTVGEAITGNKEAAQMFAKLGVPLKNTDGSVRELDDLVGDLSDSFGKMNSQQERAAYATKLFGREGQVLLPVLMQGRDHMEELFKESAKLGAGLGKDFPEKARKAREELEKFHKLIGSIKARIVAAGLPAFTQLYKTLQRILLPVLEFTKKTNILEHVLGTAATFGVLRLLMGLGKLAKMFGILKPSIGQTIMSLLKFGVPLIIIGLLALAFEDLWTMMEGGDSVIGDVLTQMDGVEGKQAFVKELQDAWNELKATISESKPIFDEVFKGLIESLPYVAKGFLVLIEGAMALGKTLKGIVDLIADTASGIATGDWSNVGKDFNKNIQSIGADFGTIGDIITGKKAAPEAPGAGAVFAPAAPGASTVAVPQFSRPGAVDNSKVVHQKNEIHVQVQGGDTPKETGQIVGQGVATKLERSNYNALLAVQGT